MTFLVGSLTLLFILVSSFSCFAKESHIELRLTTPSAGVRFYSGTSSIQLAGVVVGAKGPHKVAWETDGFQAGETTANPDFTIPPIDLIEGLNRIFLYVFLEDGSAKRKRVVVSYYHDPESIVELDDEMLEASWLQHFEAKTNHPLKFRDFLNVKSLSLGPKDAHLKKGIELCRNLEELSIHHTDLKTFRIVGFPSLSTLHFQGNQKLGEVVIANNDALTKIEVVQSETMQFRIQHCPNLSRLNIIPSNKEAIIAKSSLKQHVSAASIPR